MAQSSSTHAARILVVEDEPSIRQGLCDVLAFRGYSVQATDNGRDALRRALGACGRVATGAPAAPPTNARRARFTVEPFDLILLDVMLPELDGYSVCRALREDGEECPILMLTAKGSEEDVLEGFAAGADDYVTKPFSVRELLARVQVLLKRHNRVLEETFRAEPFDVLPDRGIVRKGETEIALTLLEIRVLRILTQNRGRIVSRRTLLREAWNLNHPEQIETRTVEVNIGKLRRKLGSDGSLHLETVRGQGYRWR